MTWLEMRDGTVDFVRYHLKTARDCAEVCVWPRVPMTSKETAHQWLMRSDGDCRGGCYWRSSGHNISHGRSSMALRDGAMGNGVGGFAAEFHHRSPVVKIE